MAINYSKTIDALTDIGKQGMAIWAADTASKSASAIRLADRQQWLDEQQSEKQQWVAEQQVDLYKTMFASSNKMMEDLNLEVAKGAFPIDDLKGANYKIYKQQWGRRADAFKQWANALGQPTYDSEEDIISLVDAVFDETVKTVDNPRKYLKFGDAEGKWAEVIDRFSPGVDLDLVEIVWNDRYSKLTGEGGGETGTGGLPAGVEDRWSVFTPEEMGKMPWWLEKGANWWLGETQQTLRDRGRAGDVLYKGLGIDKLFETGAERGTRLGGDREAPPERLELSQYEEAAQRRDSANNLLASIGNTLISPAPAAGPSPSGRTGRAGVIARQGAEEVEPLIGQQGLISGFLAQDTEEEELPDLSRQAMRFLERLSAMIQEYGAEEAFKLMSGQFKDLNKADKRTIEEYLENR